MGHGSNCHVWAKRESTDSCNLVTKDSRLNSGMLRVYGASLGWVFIPHGKEYSHLTGGDTHTSWQWILRPYESQYSDLMGWRLRSYGADIETL